MPGSNAMRCGGGFTHPITEKRKGVNVTERTRSIMVRLPIEIIEWMESRGSLRAAVEELYEGRQLELGEFFKACDEKRIDYQLAINRMVELIRED